MFRAAAGLALGLIAATSASAEVTKWKTVGGWDVSFYSEQAGCLAMAQFTEGTTFFIGFDTSGEAILMDITLIDDRWASLEEGKEYEITVQFGNESPWTLDMDARRYGESPGLAILIDASGEQATRFVDEFQRKSEMTWTYRGNQLGRFTLRGSRRAFDEAVACQKSYNNAVQSVADPFAASTSSDDPFSQ